MFRSPIFLFSLLLLAGLLALSLDMPPPPAPGPIGPYLNGVFPSAAPRERGGWELEDPLPGITVASPLRIVPIPGTEALLVLSKTGKVWRISLEKQSKELLLDVSDRVYARGDGGAVGLVLHPRFGDPAAPERQLLFLYYRTKPAPEEYGEAGFNRLSRFTWDDHSDRFDPTSEEILIQQFDRSSWHNGGALFFDPEGFLYLSVGDEGRDEQQAVSTQQLHGGFFGGILRLDVDNDPARSHPIRRQPKANGPLPDGWSGETYSQGYSIPNDNPWQSPEGDFLEEFYAIGLRSPYAMSYDAATQQIWVADVGVYSREEISRVVKGDNLQWPYREGSKVSSAHRKPEPLLGREREPYFEYDRSFGGCIIGGDLYRGDRFPQLQDKYLFADYTLNRVYTLSEPAGSSGPKFETLLSDLEGQPVALPPKPGITGVFPQPDGQVLLTVMGDYEDPEAPGKIFRLKRVEAVPEPPARLSELEAFSDLSSLTPAPGLIPYTVNAPLWSDRALKMRWLAIPNDGRFDSPAEQISFRSKEKWTFPEGSVFVKHFELPTGPGAAGIRTRLETRFFIVGEGGQGYGLTYRWNAEGTDAFLLRDGASRELVVEEAGSKPFLQTWDFPSREQCMNCHNANAGYVLGVNTHQLNGERYYPGLGRTMNQLEYLQHNGIFRQAIGHPANHPRAYPIDDTSADLEQRIRSYLDANCAACHRPGGVAGLDLDLRLGTPLPLQQIVEAPTQSHASDPGRRIVEPGDHQASELWVRDAAVDDRRMPPLGRRLVDTEYVDALAEWIDGLPETHGAIPGFLCFPNPSDGLLHIPPFRVTVQNGMGQLIRRETVGSGSPVLDIRELPAGLYLVEIMDAEEKRQVEKIVRK